MPAASISNARTGKATKASKKRLKPYLKILKLVKKALPKKREEEKNN